MPAILTAFGALLINLLRQYIPGMVGRVLLAFGIGLFTHQVALPALSAMLQTRVSAMPPVLVAYFYALGLDICFTIILSAYAARAAQRVILRKLGTT